jgi:hypothetical protein
MRRYGIRKSLKFGVFAVVATVVVTRLVMSLWNWLMPALFAPRVTSFWQALGLLALARLLLGRWGGGPGRRMHWRHRMAQRWNQMTPEEREQFAKGMRGSCHRLGDPGTTPAA